MKEAVASDLADISRDLESSWNLVTTAHAASSQILCVARRTVEIRVVGTDLFPLVTRPFQHLQGREEALLSPDLIIHVWDGAATGVHVQSTVSPGVHVASSGHLATVYASPPRIDTWRRGDRDAFCYVSDHVRFPKWAHAAPFRNILSWWLNEHELTCLHSAAVGIGDGAVLLAGEGGAGKSTAALACLESGFDYIADDFCVLENGADIHIHSLYATGNLYSDSRSMLPQVAAADSVETDELKRVHYLHPSFSERLVSHLPIRCLLLPTPGDSPGITPVSAGEAMRIIAGSSAKLWPLPARGFRKGLSAIADLARRVPCYRLTRTKDLHAMVDVVRRVLSEQHQ